MMKSKSYRKGQAALEFLTTYGWAFLVILVAIGGLSYFGVFDLGRVLPEGCKLDTNLACGDVYVLNATSGGDATLDIQLKNNRDKVVNVIAVSIIEKGLQEESTVTRCTQDLGAAGVSINPGKLGDVAFGAINDGTDSDACGIGTNVGNKKTFLIELTYNVGSSTIPVVSAGELTTTVQ